MKEIVIGFDIGSVSTKAVILDRNEDVLNSVYLETAGNPVLAIRRCLMALETHLKEIDYKIIGVGCTGSGRTFASIIIGADLVKNEITSQVVACLKIKPDVRSIIEIGGFDSKVIVLKDGIPVWHNLNLLCAAGTGSFLDAQAYRLEIPIEDFGSYALKSKSKVNIAGKCTVFAESDMIAKAASGYAKEDIINGLCEGLVRNFMNNVARNRPLEEPTIFSGGVAANVGVTRAFEKELKHKIMVPPEHKIMGCIGVALLTLKEKIIQTKFKGFDIIGYGYQTRPFVCEFCPNSCEIVEVLEDKKTIGYIGSKCGRW